MHTPHSPALPATWQDFLALTKPRVMSLVVFTGLAGLLISRTPMHPILVAIAIFCIALGGGAAGALNQWYEADIDGKMKRTAKRPLPAGRMERQSALHFGVGLSGVSIVLMGLAANWLAALLLAASIGFYVFIYTIWLKRRTPQNIVIGGAAGAFPPLIGWVAATGKIELLPVILFAFIFLWTPAHFWALALTIEIDYGAAGVPMLPNVKGVAATRNGIVLYTVLTCAAALAPYLLHMAGLFYGTVAGLGSAIFLCLALRLWWQERGLDVTSARGIVTARGLFKFSMLYLFLLFLALIGDRLWA
jgi:heme o synthase